MTPQITSSLIQIIAPFTLLTISILESSEIRLLAWLGRHPCDRSHALDNLYQQFIRKLKLYQCIDSLFMSHQSHLFLMCEDAYISTTPSG